MVINLHFLLYVLAFVCFLLGAFNAPIPRVNTIALGLAFCVLTLFV